jgi:hypothetical protein
MEANESLKTSTQQQPWKGLERKFFLHRHAAFFKSQNVTQNLIPILSSQLLLHCMKPSNMPLPFSLVQMTTSCKGRAEYQAPQGAAEEVLPMLFQQ